MRRYLVACFALMLIFTAAGCDLGFGWSFWINNSYVTNSIPSTWSSPYEADPGYDWRVLNISVTNDLRKTQTLNPFIFEFQFEAANGLTYVNQLVFNSPVNGLAWDDVQPKQTITGEIYFELPESVSYEAGTVWMVNTMASGSPQYITDISSMN